MNRNELVIFLNAQLSKINFLLNRRPIIEKKASNYRHFIPKPYKAVILISADFELAWAFRYSKNNQMLKANAEAKAFQSRKNIPKILGLCDQYNIPITWATVGHLFLSNCKRENNKIHSEIIRQPYFENEFWKYDSGDWFKEDPGTDYRTDPAWYAPDLVQKIIDSKTKHEIGCHTFSHIDSRDSVCTEEVFLSEIHACQKEASLFDLSLRSFVHPGHQIGNLKSLVNEGFTSFRTDSGDTLSLPKKHSIGIWELKNTAIIDYRKYWSINYHIYRYKKIVRRAIKYNKVGVLWFHPSFNSVIVDKVFPVLFKWMDQHKDEIWIGTHGDYIKMIENNYNERKI